LASIFLQISFVFYFKFFSLYTRCISFWKRCNFVDGAMDVAFIVACVGVGICVHIVDGLVAIILSSKVINFNKVILFPSCDNLFIGFNFMDRRSLGT
jgi:hypothetical protein